MLFPILQAFPFSIVSQANMLMREYSPSSVSRGYFLTHLNTTFQVISHTCLVPHLFQVKAKRSSHPTKPRTAFPNSTLNSLYLISYLGISRSFHILGLVRNGQFYSTVIIHNYSIFSFLQTRDQDSAISVSYEEFPTHSSSTAHWSLTSFTLTAQKHNQTLDKEL